MSEPSISEEQHTVQAKGPSIDANAFELLTARLHRQADQLAASAEELNGKRIELFGGSELAVVGSVRLRTEHNCVPRDIARVGDQLVFGYNVFIGLKKRTEVGDVFASHQFIEHDVEGQPATYEFAASAAAFLAEPRFQADFRELYEYYKNTRLLQLRNLDGKLLAVFQIGATVLDHKVLRWQLGPGGEVRYIDNRGERDHRFDPAHDFEWTTTTRADHVAGRHPHVDVLGKVFVETVGGDLTIKVENNTEDGLGIYREPVADHDQSLDDAEIHYAELGSLILLRVLPFREDARRYFVFNTRTQEVQRIDAIGFACQQLPEDHGIIFPGGYYLQNGETKIYEQEITDLEFVKRMRAPNGEDVLYIFHHRATGATLLLPYNLIRKQVQTPIRCHGYTVFESGKLVLFRVDSPEPTRVHTMQIWQTPFCTDDYAARGTSASAGSFLEQLGNAELVRGVAELLSLVRDAKKADASAAHYHALVRSCGRALDNYHWLGDEALGIEQRQNEAVSSQPQDQVSANNLAELVTQLRATATLVVDEYSKVESLRSRANEALDEAEDQVAVARREIRPESFQDAEQYVRGLARLRALRGHLISLRDTRYIDRERLDALEESATEQAAHLAQATAVFLQGEDALQTFRNRIEELEGEVADLTTVAESTPARDRIGELDEGIRLLAEVASNLEIDDALVRTAILEAISEVLGAINRVRAMLEARRRELRSREVVGEFGVEFKLYSQGVSSAIHLAASPEQCDEALGRLMMALEELEGRYAEFDDFLEQLVTKREEVYEALSAKKQQLLDERQRRAEQIASASTRILESVRRRAASLAEQDALNAFFAADPMVAKLRDQSERLRQLGDSVKADELDSSLSSARQEATRSLRDRQEIFEQADDGGELVRLGRHRFSVNSQPLDLTLVPRENRLDLHLTGTDFYQALAPEELVGTPEQWNQQLVSESDELYRAEYLAASILRTAQRQGGPPLPEGEAGQHAAAGAAVGNVDPSESVEDPQADPPPQGDQILGLGHLHAALESGTLLEVVRNASAQRYDEGYERGVHDADAAAILSVLLDLQAAAELLATPPAERALALLTWRFGTDEEQRRSWSLRIASVHRLRRAFGSVEPIAELARELSEHLAEMARRLPGLPPCDTESAATYLVEEVGERTPRFVVGAEALQVEAAFHRSLEDHQNRLALDKDLQGLDDLAARYELVASWLRGSLRRTVSSEDQAAWQGALRQVPFVVALQLAGEGIERRQSHARVEAVAGPLLGQHRRIRGGELPIRIDDLLSRYDHFERTRVPAFREFQKQRHGLIERSRHALRLEEFTPRVLSSFVRNQLLDQVYLPLIGDNLAKQIGAAGDAKRTDLMGLLLLISPPGYGKTTLMEYIASRLGLVFMKVNGPALGHAVTSLDPADAPNATARQEVEKINLAFEMGNNVLLYLDDIQHTSSELLQKFISLCDGQRRVEGVWRGRTRTYDLRGKKFAVCMAGNPYTEAGERFQIPDMLANRADVYNLGDILEGRDDLFALSYLENSLTSNPVLAPLAGRDPRDVRALVRMAQGETVPTDELSYPYAAVELEEILAVLRHLLRIQQVLLQVNQLYITSASQDDRYRTEPPFQLQGSYRNMNKLAERVSAVMNRQELEAQLDDHYLGEAQTLTRGAEWNLLRLREMRDVLNGKEKRRITEIRTLFAKARALGGAEDDPVTRVTGTLGLLADGLHSIGQTIEHAGAASTRAFEASSAQPQPEAASSFPSVGTEIAQALSSSLPPALGESLDRSLRPAAATLAQALAEALAELRRTGPTEEKATSDAAEPKGGANTAQIAKQLEGIVRGLQGIGGTLSALGSAAALSTKTTTAPAADVRVVQTLGSGVHEVLDDLGGQTAEQLLELVRGISRWAHRQEGDPDPRLRLLIDRTLTQLDRFKDLVNALKRLDTQHLEHRAGLGGQNDPEPPPLVPPPPPANET